MIKRAVMVERHGRVAEQELALWERVLCSGPVHSRKQCRTVQGNSAKQRMGAVQNSAMEQCKTAQTEVGEQFKTMQWNSSKLCMGAVQNNAIEACKTAQTDVGEQFKTVQWRSEKLCKPKFGSSEKMCCGAEQNQCNGTVQNSAWLKSTFNF